MHLGREGGKEGGRVGEGCECRRVHGLGESAGREHEREGWREGGKEGRREGRSKEGAGEGRAFLGRKRQGRREKGKEGGRKGGEERTFNDSEAVRREVEKAEERAIFRVCYIVGPQATVVEVGGGGGGHDLREEAGLCLLGCAGGRIDVAQFLRREGGREGGRMV